MDVIKVEKRNKQKKQNSCGVVALCPAVSMAATWENPFHFKWICKLQTGCFAQNGRGAGLTLI